jgi:hypothetical protein
MRAEHAEPVKNHPDKELRLGIASWDKGSGKDRSIKFAWYTKNGKVARGGEFPVDALPQALDFAIRKGYVSLT